VPLFTESLSQRVHPHCVDVEFSFHPSGAAPVVPLRIRAVRPPDPGGGHAAGWWHAGRALPPSGIAKGRCGDRYAQLRYITLSGSPKR
jgi:hypothetical protein